MGVASKLGQTMQTDAFLFVQAIRSKFWLGMLAAVDSALIAAARWPAAYKRHPGSDAEFMRFLMATREYLLSEGRLRPAGMDDEHFVMLKPICEHLVSQGRFAHSRLQLFDGLSAWNVGSRAHDLPAPNQSATPAGAYRKDGA
jgi:hypothetical protein